DFPSSFVTGALKLDAATTFPVQLNGTAPGSGDHNYDQLTADGPVDLGDSTLKVTVGFTPALGDKFTILKSTAGPIAGTFHGLSDGSFVLGEGTEFRINYNPPGSPTSVVLTRAQAPAPHVASLQQPADTVAGAPISPPVTVVVQDQFNLTVPDDSSVTLELGSHPAGGTVSGTLIV